MPRKILFGSPTTTVLCVLPETVQHLQIDCPGLTFGYILGLICQDRIYVPALETVTVNCANNNYGIYIAPWEDDEDEEGFMRALCN